MMELLDFREIKESSGDRNDLNSLLRQLIGQSFRFFRVSYGDELTVHLGELIEYSHPKMKGRQKGSYILSARASAWYFRPDSQSTMFVGATELKADATSSAHRVDIREIETRPLVEAGAIVVRVNVLPANDSFGFSLVLSDRSNLIIIPSASESTPIEADEEDEEIADWELFTPFGRFLRVGPGSRWSYLASDKPASTAPTQGVIAPDVYTPALKKSKGAG